MKLTYYSNVKDGNLQLNIRQLIAKELNHFEGKRVEITIQNLKSTRSSRQNAYWWVCMDILGKEAGYTKDEMHALAKFKLLKREILNEQTGELMPYLADSHTLNKTEFSEMTSELIRWASEYFNVILPLPETQIEIQY